MSSLPDRLVRLPCAIPDWPARKMQCGDLKLSVRLKFLLLRSSTGRLRREIGSILSPDCNIQEITCDRKPPRSLSCQEECPFHISESARRNCSPSAGRFYNLS